MNKLFLSKLQNPTLADKAIEIKNRLIASGFKFTDYIGDAELIIAIGGDGAMLQALRDCDYPETPFVGIHAGTLGFLQEIDFQNLDGFIEVLRAKTYKIAKLPLLQFTTDTASGLAFNEIVIERASARAANVSIAVNDVLFDKFIGDGLIVATPQGSSAYAVAAGGALMSEGLHAMQLVPISPHNTVAYRSLHEPLIVDINASIKLQNLDSEFRPLRLMADGEEFAVNKHASIDICLSDRQINMLRLPDYNYFKTLAQKFVK